MADEFWKNNICSDHGLLAHLRIPAMRRTICRELQSQKLFLLGSISEHGICSTDLQRKPAGHSSLSSCNKTEDLSHGHSGKGISQYTGPCQPDKRLAHICRFCPSSDSESPTTLCQRFVRYRIGTNHLRAGCHNHRPLSFAFPVGNVSQEQGGGETACSSRSERQHSNGRLYYHRESSRSQHSRQTADRSWRHLHHGSRLSGLRTTLQVTSIGSLFCNTRQEQRQVRSLLLPEDRQNDRSEIRPSRNLIRLLRRERLSRKAQAYRLLRQGSEQEANISNQQLCLISLDHHGDISQTLADRIVFQMDQAAPADQGVLRYIRERGQNTNLDCHLCLCSGGDY